MALRLDRHVVFKRFGALDPYQIARLDTALAAAKQNADQAAALAPGFFQTTWANLIGAGSTAQGMNADAAATLNLYNTLAAKKDRLVNDPNAGEADVQSFERSAGATVNTQLIAADVQLSPEGVYEQVVKPTLSTLANPFGIPLWIWGAGAVALWIVVNRRRA